MTALIATIAFAFERAFGYPAFVQRLIGHPVEWIGALIGVLDKRYNQPHLSAGARRQGGILALMIVLFATLLVSLAIQSVCRALPFGFVLEAIIASVFLASRHLDSAVGQVASGLSRSLPEGQAALQPIVGRDAASLDRHGVARASIETLAENTSDGVIAPLIFLALFGLPGIAVYKAINTADSMLGHLSERHRDFGWASARLDDVVNFVPARLTALIMAGASRLAGADGTEAWRAARRDAPHQDSPNSGWPEAAMAGALGLKLGGPRAYEGEMVELPFMGTGRAEAEPEDITRALRVYRRTNDIAAVFIAALAILGFALGFY